MNPRNLIRTVVLVTTLLFLSTPAHANMVIPFIAWTWIGMVYYLVPIIFVETIVLRLRIDISFVNAVSAATVANLVSTFAGIPICCWLLAKVRLSAETATIFVLLVVFFACSWGVETAVVSDKWIEIPLDVWNSAMLYANAVSYGLLAAYIGVKIYRSNAVGENPEWQKQNSHGKERKASDPETRELDVKRIARQPEWLHANEQAKKGMRKLKYAEGRILCRDLDLFSWRSQIVENTESLCGAGSAEEKAA